MSARELKVFSWRGFRGGKQTQEIVAAVSKAEVARLAGVDRPAQLFNLAETRAAKALETALAAPGVIFARGSVDLFGEYRQVEERV